MESVLKNIRQINNLHNFMLVYWHTHALYNPIWSMIVSFFGNFCFASVSHFLWCFKSSVSTAFVSFLFLMSDKAFENLNDPFFVSYQEIYHQEQLQDQLSWIIITHFPFLSPHSAICFWSEYKFWKKV